MVDPHARILGETDEEITLDTSEQSRQLSIEMINACRRHLNIISRDLDPCIYDNTEILDAIKKLVLRSRLARIHIIILQPESLYTRGHRLIDLAQRLSSYIAIRRPDREDASYNKALLLADDCGYIRRPHSDRFEGKANFNDRKTVSELQDEFERLWEHGYSDPNFRHLTL